MGYSLITGIQYFFGVRIGQHIMCHASYLVMYSLHREVHRV